MQLTRLELDGLRNLAANRLDLHGGLTVIVGENGQGKTSLLEAVFLLGSGRSFRARKLEEVIAWRGGPARVAGEVERERARSRLAVEVGAEGRRLLVGGAEHELESYLGRLDVVDLTAERMLVLRGGPEERRRFLDRGVVGLRPAYLHGLGRYRRLIAQRNALLRRPGSGSAELDAWDERLVEAAGTLHHERSRYAARVAGRVAEVAPEIFPAGRRLVLRYRPSPARADDVTLEEFRAILGQALAQARSRDRELGHTSLGPHRDDLQIELDGVDLRRYGSAGQVRAAMIALKLAKISLLREERGQSPVFLMDDFDTDLDEVRASVLADFLHRGGFQTLVATSKETLVGRLGVAFARVVMEGGVARTA
jgi:DNA replication and repair protein RecF